MVSSRGAKLAVSTTVNASDRCAADFFAEHIYRDTMSEIDVMYRPAKIVFAAPVLLAQGAAEEIEDRRLVKCREAFDTISETRGDQCRIVGKPSRRISVQPSAKILESLRKIQMIQAQPGSMLAVKSSSISQS